MVALVAIRVIESLIVFLVKAKVDTAVELS